MICSGLFYNVRVLYIIVLLILASCICANSQQYEGDDCNLLDVLGTCKLITDCPEVLANAILQYPQICGFSSKNPIVCCPKDEINKTLQANTEDEMDPKPNKTILYAGDHCNLKGTPGTCTPVDKCPDILRKINSEWPQTCGYQDRKHIVCCPEGSNNITAEVGKKAKEKCIEYSSYIYEWVLPDNETDPEKKIRVNNCGHIASALVIEHDATAPREYPHMAVLGMKRDDETREWICAGILISEQFVLTAAHCTLLREGELRWVRLGEHSLDIAHESETQDFSIDQIIRHPDYKPPSKYYDIAVLKLDRKAILNKFVIPACLHTEFDVQQETAVFTGWGRYGSLDDSRVELAKAELEVFTPSECYATYATERLTRLRFGITESMLCAGHHTLKRGSCHGATGGPLQVYLKTPYCMYDVIGVLSFGKACAAPNFPDVFTRVSYYIEWIESVVWPEKS